MLSVDGAQSFLNQYLRGKILQLFNLIDKANQYILQEADLEMHENIWQLVTFFAQQSLTSHFLYEFQVLGQPSSGKRIYLMQESRGSLKC